MYYKIVRDTEAAQRTFDLFITRHHLHGKAYITLFTASFLQ